MGYTKLIRNYYHLNRLNYILIPLGRVFIYISIICACHKSNGLYTAQCCIFPGKKKKSVYHFGLLRDSVTKSGSWLDKCLCTYLGRADRWDPCCFKSSVHVVTVDVLGSPPLHFTHPTIWQPKPHTPMNFLPKHTDIAFCLAHVALFARRRFKLEVALKVQKGSFYQLKWAEQ